MKVNGGGRSGSRIDASLVVENSWIAAMDNILSFNAVAVSAVVASSFPENIDKNL